MRARGGEDSRRDGRRASPEVFGVGVALPSGLGARHLWRQYAAHSVRDGMASKHACRFGAGQVHRGHRATACTPIAGYVGTHTEAGPRRARHYGRSGKVVGYGVLFGIKIPLKDGVIYRPGLRENRRSARILVVTTAFFSET